MKVKCINPIGMGDRLTFQKKYEVLTETDEIYYIIDDSSERIGYFKTRFEIIEEDEKEEVFNAQNITINIAGININCKDTPCMFATKNWNVKEDKIEKTRVKLMVDVKITKGEKSVDCNFTKGKIYDVENSDFYFYYICNDLGVLYKLSKDLFELIKEDKMEEVRVVRKLEDLDGLENGIGLVMVFDTEKVVADIEIKTLSILRVFNSEILYKVDVEIKSSLESILETAKAMGFKFEYKPSKVVYEVIKEIKSLDSLTFKQGEFNYFVSWYKGKYHVEAMRETFIIGVNYMTKEQAQKYADELNEIIGVGK
ncbi:MAG: DUF6501 family protein [Cetobacterium somerae]|uniref:DUF6501 family protein n=1 Tax=Cetobacterium somerae TaxID=188913 RepID=UPI003F30EC68